MPIIYEPRGAAREYAPLAANLYRGCTHGCRYCYVPGCLRMKQADFHAAAIVRPRVLEDLARDASRVGRPEDPILLCFTCDPYQPLEKAAGVTRAAIEILGRAGRKIRVLTKDPVLALDRDLDLLRRYDVEFGVSLVWDDDALRREWEPMAHCVEGRFGALVAARLAGLRTWVSMEPVIDPGQALAVLSRISGEIGVVKIGKINHYPKLEGAVNWRSFTQRAIEICRGAHQPYYIKDDLWLACGANMPWPGQSF